MENFNYPTHLQRVASQNSAYARHYVFRLSQPHIHDLSSEAKNLTRKALDNQRWAKSVYAETRRTLGIF